TVRFAVVPTRLLLFGPEAFVTFSAIVPPATVPFKLTGRHFALLPDLPGEVDVELELEVFGPFPGGGAASANEAAMPAASTTTSAITCFFIRFSLRGSSEGYVDEMHRPRGSCALPRKRDMSQGQSRDMSVEGVWGTLPVPPDPLHWSAFGGRTL